MIQRGCGTGEAVIRAAGIQMSLYPQESKRGATWGERGLSSRRFSAQIIQPTFSPAKRVTIPAMKERQTVSDLFQCVIINKDGLFRLIHKHIAQHIGIVVSYCKIIFSSSAKALRSYTSASLVTSSSREKPVSD